MPATIRAPEELMEPLQKLFEAGGRVEVVSEGDCSVQVNSVVSDEPVEATLTDLYIGGWIACPTALALAAKLNVGPRRIGALCNKLDIKIKHCSLGCFG